MDEKLKNFEELLKLMPFEWEQKAQELGAWERLREIRNAKGLLLVNFFYLTRNAVYERIANSEKWLKWLCENGFRGRSPGILHSLFPCCGRI
jgi:hypothetical protein